MDRPLTYDSAAAPSPFRGEFRELWRYRDLLLLLVVNSIKARYKRSVLGVAWTMLNPLLYMAIMAVVFANMFRDSLIHYPVYVLSGLLCWNFVTQATAHSMSSLVWGGGLIKRIYIPRTILVFAAVGNGLINLGLALLPLLAIMLFFGHPVQAACLFLPVAVLLMTLFTLGLALLMSVLAVFFGDMIPVYQTLIQILFFLTPVMYPRSILPQKFAWCHDFNPMVPLIEIFRAPIYFGALPEARAVLAAASWAVFAFALGWRAYTRKMDEFAYRL